MNTLEAIAKRKSTRAYKPEQISEEALETILKAGCAAPVAMARYDTLHITVVQNDEVLTRIYRETEEAMFAAIGVRKSQNYGAKTLVIISSMPPHRAGMEYTNGGIIIENMVLAATDLGIDSVILGGPIAALAASEELKALIGVPEGFTPLIGAAFGYAVEDAPAKEHSITVNRVR